MYFSRYVLLEFNKKERRERLLQLQGLLYGNQYLEYKRYKNKY